MWYQFIRVKADMTGNQLMLGKHGEDYISIIYFLASIFLMHFSARQNRPPSRTFSGFWLSGRFLRHSAL
jgi:hypothetical protein